MDGPEEEELVAGRLKHLTPVSIGSLVAYLQVFPRSGT
jgi:hypothetical protein